MWWSSRSPFVKVLRRFSRDAVLPLLHRTFWVLVVTPFPFTPNRPTPVYASSYWSGFVATKWRPHGVRKRTETPSPPDRRPPAPVIAVSWRLTRRPTSMVINTRLPRIADAMGFVSRPFACIPVLSKPGKLRNEQRALTAGAACWRFLMPAPFFGVRRSAFLENYALYKFTWSLCGVMDLCSITTTPLRDALVVDRLKIINKLWLHTDGVMILIGVEGGLMARRDEAMGSWNGWCVVFKTPDVTVSS